MDMAACIFMTSVRASQATCNGSTANDQPVNDIIGLLLTGIKEGRPFLPISVSLEAQ